ncbi:Dihydrofolate reductase [Neorhizobium galegae bv. officinalis bv. officinalis str. HAMBI 1141]|uniref:Dihydrofolate reductase n=1 Tax=Neorhizobium galegae bv. officinalis bv. officinalis str. HAMBI 1141 TaxID=1028801 RepID=A0A068T7H8_NEOGA|nr:dihydrofolate reductase [Neorhizobium galegae]CDN54378.1 Dihydrofolate reductase [Neorhizobium galegae bv. officinalis bv. officinalis str. HAMBI 1141]
MSRPRLVIIAAVSQDGVIGRDGDMPWRLSTDLKRFKALTLGKPVIVGRRTFDSFGGRPLPGRPHVIVTRNPDFHYDGVDVAASFDEAVEIAGRRAQETGSDEIFVLGGGEIYAQAIGIADMLRITHVETGISDGDTLFPAIDPDLFDKVEEIAVPAGEKDSYPTRFATYVRRAATN